MSLLSFLSEPSWQRLMETLLHTLWEAPLLALGVYFLLRWMPGRLARVRYAIASAGLAGVVMAACFTWAVLDWKAERAIAAASEPGIQAQSPSNTIATLSQSEFAEFPAAAVRSNSVRSVSHWTVIVGFVWLSGVAVMLVRIVVHAGGAYRLRRSGRAIDDGELPRLLEDLCRRMGIARNVRMRVIDGLHCPAVVGLLWPTLLIPAMQMADMPVEAWWPILAHELAHVRRYDALANLAQMLVEAVLFFNPAVWWISRQMRIEREACCDALAVEMTGEPSRYARSLVNWAEQSFLLPSGAAGALAFAEGGERRLLDRARRLLLPRYRPELRVSWFVLLAALIIGPALLAGLSRGTREAVALAAKILSPQERMQQLVEAQGTYAPMATRPAGRGMGKATIEGVLRTEDGQVLSETVHVMTRAESPNYVENKSHQSKGGHFSLDVEPGAVWIQVNAPGYAPAHAGPFSVKPGETLTGVDVQLKRGFRASIQMVEETGAPISGVILKGDLELAGCMAWYEQGESDESGMVVIAHAADGLYRLSAEADGFEPSEREVKLEPDQVLRWVLKRAKATTGVVLDENGEPISDATLRAFAELVNDHVTNMPAEDGTILAVTDETGHFTLSNLDRTKTYVLLLETPDARRQLVYDVRAGQDGLEIRLKPEIVVRGKVTGDLSRLKMSHGKPSVSYSERVRIKDHSHGSLSRDVPVQIQADGTATFEVRGILPCELSITAGTTTIAEKIEGSRDELVIDVSAATKRTVLFTFKMPEGTPPPSGTLTAYSNMDQRPRLAPIQDIDIEVLNGQAEFDAYVGGQLRYEPRRLVGAWFKEGRFERVPEGESPLVVEIPAEPAGAIVGRVVAPTQNGAHSRISISVRAAEGSKPVASNWPPLHNIELDPGTGRFMATPLPLGCQYVAIASRGKNIAFSEPVLVDPATPLQNIEIKMAAGRDAEVIVIGPDGQPVQGVPVAFSYESSLTGNGGYSPDPLTDEKGRIRFEDINPDPRIKYSISVPALRGYTVIGARPIQPGGEPTVITLQRGLTLEGRVIEGLTGEPLVGCKVYAYPPFDSQQKWVRYEAEAVTDGQGRFRFSNLAPGEYRISGSPQYSGRARYSQLDENRYHVAGQAEPVEIQINVEKLDGARGGKK